VANDKLIRIAHLIYEKTKNGEIKWEATADESTFQASLSNYSILIKRAAGTLGGTTLQICNEQGQVIEEFTQFDFIAGGFPQMAELFELARRMAMGVEKALDDLIGALEASPQRK